MRGFLANSEFPVQFSGHETFPLRQLWLRKAFEAAAESDPQRKSVFVAEDAIARFGIGKNMVTSMRHWAMAARILEDVDGSLRPTRFAEALLGENGLDPFGEHPGTAWLIHWFLAGDGRRSTTWAWLFNHVPAQSFTRASLFKSLQAFVAFRNLRVSDLTLKRDIECCIRSYVPRTDGSAVEDMAEPILGELGLILESSRGSFEFRRGSKHTLPDGVFVYALLDFWERLGQTAATLSFERIAHEYGSPGRVFKLNEDSIADRLIRLESITKGKLVWTETAGMRQISRISSDTKLDSLKQQMLRAAYAR